MTKKYIIATYDYPVVYNLDKAIQKLDKIQINSGEKFSLNLALGPRSKGYKKAKTYFYDGSVILEKGGGLCMISSILYHVFLEAGFEIIERHPHTKPVSYVASGYDAAISYGHKNLIVQNTSKYPASIHLERQGKTLTARFFHQRKKNLHIILLRKILPSNLTKTQTIEMRRLFFSNDELTKEEIISRDVIRIAKGNHLSESYAFLAFNNREEKYEY